MTNVSITRLWQLIDFDNVCTVRKSVRCRQSTLEGLANQRKTHTYIIITYLFKFSYFNFLISVISFILVHYFFFPLSFVYISVIEYLLLICLHL